MATREVIFSQTLTPGQTAYIEWPCPLDGEITTIVRQWPDGSNGLVDIAVGHSNKWILPNITDRYVALNDITVVIPIRGENVKKEETLWVSVRNRDAFAPHTPSVTIVVSEVGKDDS